MCAGPRSIYDFDGAGESGGTDGTGQAINIYFLLVLELPQLRKPQVTTSSRPIDFIRRFCFFSFLLGMCVGDLVKRPVGWVC